MHADKTHVKRMYKLGAFLKELREGLGLSVRAAARQAEITPPHLSNIERGTGIKSIGVPVLVNLAEVYRVPVSTILKEAEFLQSADERDGLPDFATYLRRKLNYGPHAIRDMELAKEIVEKKYVRQDATYSPPPRACDVQVASSCRECLVPALRACSPPYTFFVQKNNQAVCVPPAQSPPGLGDQCVVSPLRCTRSQGWSYRDVGQPHAVSVPPQLSLF